MHLQVPIYTKIVMNRQTVFFLLLIVVGQIGCRNKQPEAAAAFRITDSMLAKCEFAKANLADVKNDIRFFGKITADNNKTAQVYPVVGGVVKTIDVGLGDYVNQGQVLATIQSGEVAGFEKDRLTAINNQAIAEKNLQVAKDLFEGKLNSEKDVTQAEKELEIARSEVDRIKQLYGIYQLSGGSIFRVTAPTSGFVISKKIVANELLRSDNADPVFEIADTREIWAVANVNESDIGKVQQGYTARIKTLSFPDTTFVGKIDKIYNVIDRETKSMKIRITIPNYDFKLKAEMNCTVNISFSENKALVAVPSRAIIFDKSKYWVMVFVNKDQIETREVDLYRQLDELSYVSAGIAEGETVITQNALLIYDALND